MYVERGWNDRDGGYQRACNRTSLQWHVDGHRDRRGVPVTVAFGFTLAVRVCIAFGLTKPVSVTESVSESITFGVDIAFCKHFAVCISFTVGKFVSFGIRESFAFTFGEFITIGQFVTFGFRIGVTVSFCEPVAFGKREPELVGGCSPFTWPGLAVLAPAFFLGGTDEERR